MIESREVEVNPETSKNSIDTTSSIKVLNNNNNFETLTIKPRVTTSKFETIIINAYKKLVGYDQIKNDTKKLDKKAEKAFREEAEKLNVNECETELRKALEEVATAQNIFLNKNIIDKTTRISKRSKINLSLIIGQIYIQLMNKTNLFSKLNQKNSLDKNLIISFINEVINMNSLLKNTYLCIKYENALFEFLGNIIKEIAFDSEQLNEINVVLQEHKTKKEEKKLNTKSSKEFLASLNEAFNKQNSLYGQYKVVLDNCQEIVELINNANCNESEEVHNYFEFGILLIKLFFGKKCILLNDKNNNDENLADKVTIKKLFDGFEDNSHGNVNLILGEKFYVDYDCDLEPMRENLCSLILKFIEKFKNITNLLEFQYIHFVLLKRIYFFYFEKFKNEMTPIFVQILINLCAFKESEKIKQVIQFVNALLNSKEDKDAEFIELLKQKIEEAKNNADFNFNYDNKLSGNFDQMQNEIIYVEEENLNIGFFTNTEIKAGETMDIYVELSKPLGLIDFCCVVKNHDINLTVTNLSEGNVVYQQKKLKSEKKAFKLTLFFTKPGIFKFEFDNSYSWVRDKSISYKINTFYPQIPSIFENKVAISRYQEIINNQKKISGKKISDDNKLEIIQDQLSYQYNINDIKENIALLNSMIVSFQVKILSLYIDKEKDEEGEGNEKKYFYYEKENFVKNELTQENLEAYLNENKNQKGITIVNLFIISGDGSEVLNCRDLSLPSVLGFEPTVEDENKNTILYFIQYYNQAQLLYYLINKAEDQQNALLINYTKYGGYQIAIYINGEIITEVEELKKINKSEFLENNIELICGAIRKLGQEHLIKILVTDSVDIEEKNITAEKMSETLQKTLGINSEQEGNYKIIKLNKDFNKEVKTITHLLNLIE
jgi:hypothetical protein